LKVSIECFSHFKKQILMRTHCSFKSAIYWVCKSCNWNNIHIYLLWYITQ
jgi:hypothetical protein